MSDWREKYRQMERAVPEYLEANGVRFSATFTGKNVDDDDGKEWEHFAWSCRFERGARPYVVAYRCGLGHVVEGDVPLWARATHSVDAVAMRQRARPKPPTAAEVIYSVLMDARAVGISFTEWCADCGMETDSRKALRLYERCQEEGDKLRAFFTADELSKLGELVADL